MPAHSYHIARECSYSVQATKAPSKWIKRSRQLPTPRYVRSFGLLSYLSGSLGPPRYREATKHYDLKDNRKSSNSSHCSRFRLRHLASTTPLLRSPELVYSVLLLTTCHNSYITFNSTLEWSFPEIIEKACLAVSYKWREYIVRS